LTMRRFLFSMQALYDVKTAAEKQAMADWAAAKRAADQAEAARDRCGQKLLQERKNLEGDARQGITVLEFQSRSAYEKLLQQQVQTLETELSNAREIVRDRQACLQTIYKERKSLERVREVQQTAFSKEQYAKEAKELDDLLAPGMTKLR